MAIKMLIHMSGHPHSLEKGGVYPRNGRPMSEAEQGRLVEAGFAERVTAGKAAAPAKAKTETATAARKGAERRGRGK